MEVVLVGSTAASVVGIYMLKVAGQKAFEKGMYKAEKWKILKGLQKSIDNLEYKKFIEYVDKLKAFSAHHNRNKFHSFKKREKINDTIINNPHLWRLKYDPDYMVQELQRTNSSSVNDRLEKIEDFITHSVMLKPNQSRLDL